MSKVCLADLAQAALGALREEDLEKAAENVHEITKYMIEQEGTTERPSVQPVFYSLSGVFPCLQKGTEIVIKSWLATFSPRRREFEIARAKWSMKTSSSHTQRREEEIRDMIFLNHSRSERVKSCGERNGAIITADLRLVKLSIVR